MGKMPREIDSSIPPIINTLLDIEEAGEGGLEIGSQRAFHADEFAAQAWLEGLARWAHPGHFGRMIRPVVHRRVVDGVVEICAPPPDPPGWWRLVLTGKGRDLLALWRKGRGER